MAYRRSNAFNADVNQDLLKLIEGFQYDPYTVQAISGYRPGDPRQHGRGNALDIELIDPKSGQRLGNYQDPSTFGAYQQYANALYQHALQSNPELAQKLRWGGYFSGGKGKYGALDLMHFDIAGGPGGLGMGGGSWAGGLTPEQAKIWNLQAGSGGVSNQQQGPPSPPQDPQQAFVWKMWPLAVEQGKRTGVDPRIIMAQAAQETGWGKSVPGENYFGIKGSAANTGAPQQTLEFVGGKMVPTRANFRGYKGPAESFEDYGSFLLNNPRYQALREAKGLEAQAAALQASGYATDPNYGASVLKIAQGIPEGGYGSGGAVAPTDSPSESTGGPGAGAGGGAGAPPPAAAADPWWKRMGKALGGAGATNFGVGGAAPAPLAPSPGAAVSALNPVAPINVQQEELKRKQLAAAMARLNQGTLWG